MSLNIKNEVTHQLVRQLAELTGLSQTAAVEDAVRHRLADLQWSTDTRAARVEYLRQAIRAELTDELKEDIRRASEELYDSDGLPR